MKNKNVILATLISISVATSILAKPNENVNEVTSFWSKSQLMTFSNINLENGNLEESKQDLIKIAQQGLAEAQFNLYIAIKKGIIKVEELPDSISTQNLLTDSSNQNYLPAIKTEIMELEKAAQKDESLFENERWSILVKNGAQLLDPNLILIYAAYNIYQAEEAPINELETIQLVQDAANKHNIADLYNFLGNYYAFETSDGLLEAKDWFMKSVAIGDLTASNNLAFILAEANMYLDKAETLSVFTVRSEPTAVHLDTLGWIYFQKQDYKKAEQFILAALKLNSRDWEIAYHLGKVYLQQEKNEKAIDILAKSLDLLSDIEDKSFVERKEKKILNALNDIMADYDDSI